MDSNDRERVEEARAELKKMVNLCTKKKKRWNLFNYIIYNDVDIEWSS